jgi:hypothetical protein
VPLLARHGWLIAIAVTYLYVFPYFPRIHSANELPRVYLVKAIVDDHGFSIDQGPQQWPKAEGGGPTADITRVRGHQYSNKAPGSSMLAVLPYAAVELVAGQPSLPFALWICRVFAGVIPMLLFLPLLYRFLERYAPEPAIRQLVCLAYALGSAAMPYSMLYFSHQLAAICIASAWIIGIEAAERTRGLRWFGIAGALAGASALVDYQAIFAAVPIAVQVAIKIRSWPRRDLAIALGTAAGCALIPIAIMLGYHAICFGSPWATGYGAIAGDTDAGTNIAFANNHKEGFLGLTRLRPEAFVGATNALDTGLFSLSPWLLAAFPGFAVLWREARSTAIVGAVVLVGYILFLSALTFWRGGWGIGPRYITVLLPFVLPAVAAALTWLHGRDRRIFGAVAGTALAGIAIYTLATVTFPYWPESSKHPLYEVTFRLLGDNLVAPNLGGAIGLPGIVGLAPVLLAIAGIVGWTICKTSGRIGLVLASAVMLAIVGGYALAPRGANADHVYDVVSGAVDNELGDARLVCAAPGRDLKAVYAYAMREGLFGRDVRATIEAAAPVAELAAAIRARIGDAPCPTLDLLERARP